MAHDLKALLAVLNPTCRQALEDAAAMCVEWGHYAIELEHVLVRLLRRKNTDLRHLLTHFDLDVKQLSDELKVGLSKLRGGNKRVPTFSERVPKLLQEAWLFASLELGSHRVRSGAILWALRTTEGIRDLITQSAPSLRRIDADRLRNEMAPLIANSVEAASAAAGPHSAPPSLATAQPTTFKSEILDQYTHDLTAKARSGGFDPIVGRDREIRQLVDILTRRRQNNPIIVGEAGVGKTAVVEGLALAIAKQHVPPSLRGVSLRQLDLTLLSAGASLQGEFEKRLKAVIAEVGRAVAPVVLFIDEAHTLIGAGGAAGHSDAANLLKPALARGELRTIAATTWREYKEHIEPDPALARRFQPVKVAEPDAEGAITMLRGVAAKLERHHHVRIREEAVRDAVKLSQRYITGRRLPDKALGLLDTAAARVAIGQRGTPGPVQDALARVTRLEEEVSRLEREQDTDADHRKRLAQLLEELDGARREQTELESRWEAERSTVEHVRDLEHRLATRAADPDSVRKTLRQQRESLALLQGDAPMVPLDVDGRVIAEVVSSWTGVPIGRMLTDEAEGLLRLPELLGGRVIGQQTAIDVIAHRMRTSRAGLVDPDKPVGVFLLVGPSGVGKTETAAALADALYGGADDMIVVNLSEYQEPHSVAQLKGAPPGYVGYARGGVLTEAVRRRPYSVVLLDEVEKAHPDVLEIFFQVFDKGRLDDGQGVSVDFRNTTILLTSNVGSDIIEALCRDGRPSAEAISQVLRPVLQKAFSPALLGRMAVVPYYPLGQTELDRIARLKLGALQRRFADTHYATLTLADAVAEAVVDRAGATRAGARSLEHLIAQEVLPLVSTYVLTRLADGDGVVDLTVGVDADDQFVVVPTADAPAFPARERRSYALEIDTIEAPVIAPAPSTPPPEPAPAPTAPVVAEPAPAEPAPAEPVSRVTALAPVATPAPAAPPRLGFFGHIKAAFGSLFEPRER